MSEGRYAGGKNGGGAFQRLINQVPPHRVYVELFAGSAAVHRHIRRAELSILVERDPAQWDLLAIAGEAAELMAPGRIAGNGEGRGATVRIVIPGEDGPTLDVFGDGRRHLAVSGEGACLAGSGDAGLWVVHGCALAFLDRYQWTGQEFVYADPPYLFSVRSSASRMYTHEFGTEAEHRALLGRLRNLPCSVMVSGYASGLYADLLGDWRQWSFRMMTRGGRSAVETVWCNYPEPVALHDYRWLGDSFRQRERIKRQQARWRARLARMGRLERQALLSVLHDPGAIDGSGEGGSLGPSSPELAMTAATRTPFAWELASFPCEACGSPGPGPCCPDGPGVFIPAQAREMKES